MNESNYQNKFVNSILNQKHQIESDIYELVKPIGKIDVKKVLEVYSNDYKYRLLDALKSSFEACWMVLGDERFESLSIEYIFNNPSKMFDLNFYGAEFPRFLESKNELLEEIPFIAELASFELSFWDVFHSENPITPKANAISSEQILNSYFSYDEHTVLLKFDHNIFPLFQYKTKSLDEFLAENDTSLIIIPAFYILYKKDYKVICHELSHGQYQFFLKFKENKSLIDVINSTEDATQKEIESIFKLISSELLRNLQESR